MGPSAFTDVTCDCGTSQREATDDANGYKTINPTQNPLFRATTQASNINKDTRARWKERQEETRAIQK